MPELLSPRDTSLMLLGALQAQGRLYPSAIMLNTTDDWIKGKLHKAYGGTIEPTRWVLKSVPQRKRLLKDWAPYARGTRINEIEDALDSLGAS